MPKSLEEGLIETLDLAQDMLEAFEAFGMSKVVSRMLRDVYFAGASHALLLCVKGHADEVERDLRAGLRSGTQ